MSRIVHIAEPAHKIITDLAARRQAWEAKKLADKSSTRSGLHQQLQESVKAAAIQADINELDIKRAKNLILQGLALLANRTSIPTACAYARETMAMLENPNGGQP